MANEIKPNENWFDTIPLHIGINTIHTRLGGPSHNVRYPIKIPIIKVSPWNNNG